MASRHYDKQRPTSPLAELWNSFWMPPHEACPRCGGKLVEYYDPFFFSPMRTLQGRRRHKCTTCKFVWRPSSRGRSLMSSLNPFKTY